ncbi:MAG TPA: carboxylesterase/lipase family protein [Rhizomicrobium sp.]|jgi:para-nitrobenzyl esterase
MDRASGGLETVTIETADGWLAGQRGGDVLAFKAIPFAAPPVGPLRWRMPEPPEPWTGVRDATHFGPMSPQAPTQIEALLGGSLGAQSEDCLYLNVWTPGCDNAKRPVMVWIHGGAFVIGSASQGLYNGKHLAARDCVVVTINYRLGALGFLNLRDATDGKFPATGSEGIADQVMALNWVKRNIALFGGDPDNVTVFGESAGGMSVACLLAMPAARGLFHKGIMQSGSAHIGHTRERSARVAQVVMQKLGIAAGEVDKLADVTPAELIEAQVAMFAETHEGDAKRLGEVMFQPTIDGSLIAAPPIDSIRAGSGAGIPVLAGTTKEEWKLFSAANPRLRLMSRSKFEDRIRRIAKEDAPILLAAYAEGTTFDRFNAVMTDKVFAVPTSRMLEAQGASAPVYQYRFDWRSRLLGGLLGSCHAIDLGFTFGTHNVKLAGAFFGSGATAAELATAVMDSWVAFARTCNPSCHTVGEWPRYNTDTRATMILGDGNPHVAERPNEARRAAWDNLEHRLGPA